MNEQHRHLSARPSFSVLYYYLYHTLSLTIKNVCGVCVIKKTELTTPVQVLHYCNTV